jgi:hypothetical protein
MDVNSFGFGLKPALVHNGYAAMNGRSATMATLAESKHRKIGPFNARARTPVPPLLRFRQHNRL